MKRSVGYGILLHAPLCIHSYFYFSYFNDASSIVNEISLWTANRLSIGDCEGEVVQVAASKTQRAGVTSMGQIVLWEKQEQKSTDVKGELRRENGWRERKDEMKIMKVWEEKNSTLSEDQYGIN